MMEESDKLNTAQNGKGVSLSEIAENVSPVAEWLWGCTSSVLKGGDVSELVFSDASIKLLKVIVSVPDMLLMRKVERFCRGLQSLSEKDAKRYEKKIGKLTSEREHIFLLNVINKIEEEEKISFLASTFAARVAGELGEKDYKRLALMIESTMFDDLNFLLQKYKDGSVTMGASEAQGLLSNGWLYYDGQTWGTVDDDGSKIYKFTKMADILYSTISNFKMDAVTH